MNCEEFRKEVPFLASGEPEAPELREHLETCASCRDELEDARRFDGLLRGAFEGLAPGEGFEARVAAGALGEREATPKVKVPTATVPTATAPIATAPRAAAPAIAVRSWIPWSCAAASLLLAALTATLAVSGWKKSIESVEAKLASLEAAVEEGTRAAVVEKDLLARALIEEARRDLEAQEPLRALPLLTLLAARSPSDEVLRLRARARLDSGDMEGAIADTSALIQKGSASAEDYRLRSLAHERIGSQALATTDRAEAVRLEAEMLMMPVGEDASADRPPAEASAKRAALDRGPAAAEASREISK
jgi:hypothetical protein